MVACASPDEIIYNGLAHNLVSRFNVYMSSLPTEESLTRFLSTTLTCRFQEKNFPLEVSSVIPTIVQSSLKVFNDCKSLILAENAKRPFTFLTVPPNLLGLFHVVQGCAGLPKESAENKKMFTRLWVHEAMRSFYDRMTKEEHMEAVFASIRGCVKNIFKENFDSAFEHLGKVNGHVTQLNMRNLLFGCYMPTEEGATTAAPEESEDPPAAEPSAAGGENCVEVTAFDAYERVVQRKIKSYNRERGKAEVNILPIR